jgi:MFS family permease
MARRVLPFLLAAYLICIIDRLNVGLAALTMNAELGFTATVYGWGAGLFFVGYFIGEVPSNMILTKVGARVWFARIMVTWGIFAVAMGFISGDVSFFVIRFLLGVAEAGFFPGVIYYLTLWFPAEYRGRIFGPVPHHQPAQQHHRCAARRPCPEVLQRTHGSARLALVVHR